MKRPPRRASLIPAARGSGISQIDRENFFDWSAGRRTSVAAALALRIGHGLATRLTPALTPQPTDPLDLDCSGTIDLDDLLYLPANGS